MVLVQVDYYPELDVTGGVAPLKVGNTEFKVLGPANRRNEIDSEEWQKIQKLPSISMRLDKGILRLVGGGQMIQPTKQTKKTETKVSVLTADILPVAEPELPQEPQLIQQALFTPSIAEPITPETTSTRKKKGTTSDEATNS